LPPRPVPGALTMAKTLEGIEGGKTMRMRGFEWTEAMKT
jgi:hypothetical protein